MSQIHEVGVPSVGKPSKRIEITWDDFVKLVLELTVQAYQAMREDKIAQQNWEENTFTLRLAEDYLRIIAYESSIFAHVRTKTHTQKMKTGEQTTIEAKEIDLTLYGSWEIDYHKVHFVWEAKKVGDKRITDKYSVLNSEYINEAIYRFIQREYADGLSDAGILAYVLAGKPETIVKDINQTMGRIRKKESLPPSNHLQITKPIGDFKDVYKSNHTRIDETKIALHHLFLCFDFAD